MVPRIWSGKRNSKSHRTTRNASPSIDRPASNQPHGLAANVRDWADHACYVGSRRGHVPSGTVPLIALGDPAPYGVSSHTGDGPSRFRTPGGDAARASLRPQLRLQHTHDLRPQVALGQQRFLDLHPCDARAANARIARHTP